MWSNAVLSRLIKEFKNRPALWDDEHRRYGDTANSRSLIREIANTLTREFASAYTEDDVRRQWDRLKSKLVLYIAKLDCWANNSEPQSGVPTFKYARLMDFLMDDDSIVTFRNKTQAVYQCSVCGSYFGSPKLLRMHKTVKCPAVGCDWEGDGFSQHLQLQHPYMSLASLLKSVGSSVSLRCVLLSTEKTVSESTPKSVATLPSGLSQWMIGRTGVEKCEEAEPLEPNMSVHFSTPTVDTNHQMQVFRCPLDGCSFSSSIFDHFNAHLVGQHSNVFRVGTAIEVTESYDNDESFSTEHFETVDGNVSLISVDGHPSASNAMSDYSSQFSTTLTNMPFVDSLKNGCLFDSDRCSKSKSMLTTELPPAIVVDDLNLPLQSLPEMVCVKRRRVVNNIKEIGGDEIMQNIQNASPFEVAVTERDTDASNNWDVAALTPANEGTGVIKTEKRGEDPEEVTVECDNSSVVAPIVIRSCRVQATGDVPSTSTSNLQICRAARAQLKVEGTSINREAIAAEILMEEGFTSPEDGKSLNEDDEDEEDLTACKFHPLMHDQRSAALWMKRRRLIASSMCCKSCSQPLRWTVQEQCVDCFVWKCFNVGCDRCDECISIRSGSIFEDARLPLGWHIEVMRLWSIGVSVRKAVKESGIPAALLVAAYRRFREVCVEYIRKNPLLIGGPYSDCQALIIPVTVKSGREPLEVLIMTIVDLNSKPKVFHLEAVTDVGPEALMPVIRRVVVPGTKIHCDPSVPWQALTEFSAKTREMQSGCFYFDKSQLRNAKKMDAMRLLLWKLKRELIITYRLCGFAKCEGADWEYLWRYRFGEDPFVNLCHHIIV